MSRRNALSLWFVVQREDPYTVHLKSAHCRDTCVVSSLVLYQRSGVLGKRSEPETCRTWNCYNCRSTRQHIWGSGCDVGVHKRSIVNDFDAECPRAAMR
jgi:hypothetical protein